MIFPRFYFLYLVLATAVFAFGLALFEQAWPYEINKVFSPLFGFE